MRVRFFWLITGLLMGLPGCQSAGDPNAYLEPDASVVDTATLDIQTTESYWVFGTSFVQIIAIDGKNLPILTVSVKDKYQITPGSHEIVAWYRSAVVASIKDTRIPLSFEAIAGKTYEIRASEDNDMLFVWLQDAENSEVISKATMTSP